MAVNVPVSIWRNTDGLGEYSGVEVQDIIDTAGIELVDTAGINVVDTGILFTNIPDTVWEEDDGI